VIKVTPIHGINVVNRLRLFEMIKNLCFFIIWIILYFVGAVVVMPPLCVIRKMSGCFIASL